MSRPAVVVDARGIDPTVAMVLSWAACGDHAIVVIDTGPRGPDRRDGVKQRLAAMGITCDMLLTGPNGGTLRDEVLKSVLYDEVISDNYKVALVIETNPAAITMWREHRIPGFLVERTP